ncbi:HEAT repeat domain-containing protein [Fulvivirgaceae bacterium BMA12]|uniref:HEAT repeat domain-containing protein n=1 Tax=Agaribacillus aureus TaxID=3051825 RepID=A0ABT8L472_9BACT|nr:HEAT repeat domain-containing protein [Fulvivirgaceae bacterium BMA12]
MALDNTEKNDYTQLLMSFLKNELTDDEKLALLKAARENQELARELIEVQNTWTQLNKYEVPAPAASMDAKFQNMLLAYKTRPTKFSVVKTRQNISDFFKHMWPTHTAARTAMASLLVLVVFFAGYWFSYQKSHTAQITRQYDQIKELQTNMMLTLLAQKSPVERLKAVSISQDLKEINTSVIEALLNTLNQDDNDNVRLASLEALIAYAADPRVREGLIMAISHQKSPLVQMALAETMVELQEKRSVGPLKDLLRSENTPEEIKDKIQESINILI